MKPAAAILLVALASGTGQAAAASPDKAPEDLLRSFEALNSACRGGRGDDPKTTEACAERDALFRQLVQAGWCFGHDGEIEAQKEWRRCDEVLPMGGRAGVDLVVEPTAEEASLHPRATPSIRSEADTHVMMQRRSQAAFVSRSLGFQP